MANALFNLYVKNARRIMHNNTNKMFIILLAATDVPHTVHRAQALVDHDIVQWRCSHQQKIWMRTELQTLGLWPGTTPGRVPFSLWRHPPQPELIDTVSDLPSPKHFQLHPFFIWKPENKIMERLRNNYILPCLSGCTNPQVISSGVAEVCLL